jgi:hypothetical protein
MNLGIEINLNTFPIWHPIFIIPSPQIMQTRPSLGKPPFICTEARPSRDGTGWEGRSDPLSGVVLTPNGHGPLPSQKAA